MCLCLRGGGPVAAGEVSLPPIVIIAPRVPEGPPTHLLQLDLTRTTLLETPRSATVLPRALLEESGAAGPAALLGNDPSVGENYAPLGY